jgi:transcriptional regulator with XRE-family HTH domain
MPRRDETLTAFGRNVAKFRNERGFSQDKLAEGASLDRTYLSGIERGVRNPGIKVVINVARVLNVSIDPRSGDNGGGRRAKHGILRVDSLNSKL